MNLPSTKTLTQVAGDKAQELRELLEKKRKTRDYQSVKTWVSQSYHEPRYSERLMCAINEIVGGYGVEAITKRGQVYPTYEYINMGDTYTTTILRDCRTGRVFVGTWGDIVERGGYD